MPTTTHHFTANDTLTPRAPFDIAQTLAFLQRFGPMAGEQIIAGGTLTKAMSHQGRAVAFTLQSAGSIERPALAYTLHAERDMALDRIRFFLSLGDDLEPF